MGTTSSNGLLLPDWAALAHATVSIFNTQFQKIVAYVTILVAVSSPVMHRGNRRMKKKDEMFFFVFVFPSPFLFPVSVAPPYVKDPPSVFPRFFFFPLCPSVPLLCALSPPLPSPCTLWYADMQEFLGLKMIDQTCQPWLLLLKMAAFAVCVCL